MMDDNSLKKKGKLELVSIVHDLLAKNKTLKKSLKFEKTKATALSALNATSSATTFFKKIVENFPIKPTSTLRLVLDSDDILKNQIAEGHGVDSESFSYLDQQVAEQLGGKYILEVNDTSKIHNLVFDPEKPYPRSIYAFPLLFLERKVGIVWIADKNTKAYSAEDIADIKTMVEEFEWSLGFLADYLRTEQARSVYLAAIDSADDPILLCDFSGTIVESNQTAKKVFSLNVQEDKLGEDVLRLFSSLKNLPERFTITVDFAEYSGKKTKIKFQQSAVHYAYRFTNITKERERERYLEGVIGALTHRITGELENINGFVSLALALGELSSKQEKYLQKIAEASEQIASESHDLLSVNRLKAEGFLSLSMVDLVGLITNTVDRFAPVLTQKQLQIQMNLGGSPKMLLTDSGLVKQLLLNLMESAARDASMGSEIEIILHEEQNGLAFSILDKGVGLSAPDISAILGNSAKVAETHKNLYNARIITTLLLGSIEIDSQLGEGKKVKILLKQID